jgi:hypothetical protein
MTEDEAKMTDKLEILARAWIECDPNRQPADPDEIMTQMSGELKDQPRWRWFMPRAVALEEYLERHGFVIVRAERVGLAGRP